MNQPAAQSISLRGAFHPDKVTSLARELAARSGRASQLAFAFVTEEYVPHIEEFCDILRVDGRVVEVVGCTGIEVESAGTEQAPHLLRCGCSVLALQLPDATVQIQNILHEDAPCPKFLEPGDDSAPVWISLFDPSQFSPEPWLQRVNQVAKPVSCIGGMASATNASGIAVFHNGRVVNGGVVVSVGGPNFGVRGFVSQGCRPIGEPLTVTRAENNVVYALGGQPAYQALATAFETLSSEEKAVARGNLFAGLATNEYVEEFHSGDFIVRSILGADPNSGAVVIAGAPRVGQTLQYHFRNPSSSSHDLHENLTSVGRGTCAGGTRQPFASLIFRCAARGEDFFGQPCHDLGMTWNLLGAHSCAALACAAEIAPLHSVNSLTTFSTTGAVFT